MAYNFIVNHLEHEVKKTMTFEEKTLDTERIFQGKIINVRRDRVTVMEGESFREIVEHNGGAVIAAVKPDGKMIMVSGTVIPKNQKMRARSLKK